jgi:UDPglucose--hexose-1-phosphate uridylyltransferase
MSELRQDPTTREWVIIATERARRPHDFAAKDTDKAPMAAHNDTCPFCPGNEAMTPGEVYRIADDHAAGDAPWQVRVVPNKFAALTPADEPGRRTEKRMFHTADGFGYHEVVVETPLHNRYMALMEDAEVARILCACRDRYQAIRADTNIKFVVIFKNHGRAAGTSLEHPHSQIVGVPIIPGSVRSRVDVAQRFYDDTGDCIYCVVLDRELKAENRIVFETPEFVVFQPFASRVPFETWIMPRTHCANFGSLSAEDCGQLAPVLRTVLAKLYRGLNNPDFNIILQTAPVEDEDRGYYHWHMQIFPRLTLQAGFELGSGIYITTALPEQTAAFLRDIQI